MSKTQARLALNTSLADFALITAVAADPPAAPWRISDTVSLLGRTSLRSGDIGDSEQSCLVFSLSLSEPILVQFSRRVSSQPADELYFAAGSQRLEYHLRPVADTVLRNWSRELYIVAEDTTAIRWCYSKDGSVSEGEDSAWIDNLSFSPTAVLTRELVCLVLDMSTSDCALITAVAAEPSTSPWVVSDTANEGGNSLRSGDIDDSESSCLVLGIALPAARNISFSLRTDSEAVNDSLYFEAGGQRLLDTFAAAQGSGLRDWEQQQFILSANISTLRWCYTKNDSGSAGEDSGWLDSLLLAAAISTNGYTVQIVVIRAPTVLPADSGSFRIQVTVAVLSATLPTPSDWMLIASGIDNISAADTAYPLVFSGSSAPVEVIATPDNPLLPSTILLALEDRPILRWDSRHLTVC